MRARHLEAEAAAAGLCDTLRNIIHIFSSVFIGSTSFSTNITEFDGLRILKQTFLAYRNVCANAPRSQQVAAKSGALTIALQFVLAMMKLRRDDFEKDAGEQWQTMGIAAVKSALQFIGNAIVMCAANQKIVWDFCISEQCLSEMMVVGARMDRGVFGIVVMIVYNCLCKCKASSSRLRPRSQRSFRYFSKKSEKYCFIYDFHSRSNGEER